jgi:hypothetical protein
MDRKRLLRLLLLGAALVVAMLIARHWPKEQTVHYVLGDGATRVEEVDARWAEGRSSEDWTREATFRYAPGQAPRIVTHEPRLPDGDYTVEIEIASASAARNVVRRNVTLTGGGATSIDLAESVPR